MLDNRPALEYINTWSGRKYYPLEPEKLDVSIDDIAHGLSHINRYGGHLDVDFYSVAQHSYLVEELVLDKIEGSTTKFSNKYIRLQALLHDATEAYLGDIPSPIKKVLPDYKALEKRLQEHIFNFFGLPPVMYPIIKQEENKLLVPEIVNLSYGWDLNEFFGENSYSTEYIDMGITYWPPRKAKARFLGKFNEISRT